MKKRKRKNTKQTGKECWLDGLVCVKRKEALDHCLPKNKHYIILKQAGFRSLGIFLATPSGPRNGRGLAADVLCPQPLKAGVGVIGAAANRGAAFAALQRCEQGPPRLTPSPSLAILHSIPLPLFSSSGLLYL